MTGNTFDVADALALQRDGNRLGEGNGWWIILFLIVLWGGFGGNMWNRCQTEPYATQAQVASQFDFNTLNNGIRGIQQGLCDGFYAQNTTMLHGFNGIGSQIANLGYQMQNCCCETNRNIDSLKYQSEKNTCDIINSGTANTQRIIDTIQGNVIQELRDNLQSAQWQLSQINQTDNIVSRLQPVPQPAYLTCSPYQSQMLGLGACVNNGCCNR